MTVSPPRRLTASGKWSKQGEMKFYMKTFGCQMNVHDSRRIAALLEGAGHVPDTERSAADLLLVNTCSVREKAWHKAVSEAGRLRTHKRRGREPLVVVAGCVAEQEREHLFKLLPEVDLVIGPDHYQQLPQLIEELVTERRSLSVTGFDEGRPEHFLPLDGSGAPVSSFVTVMKGCEERCAYCIVPSVRGPERSRPPADILDEARSLVARGAREITLLGQKVNSYSMGGSDLATLLEQLDTVEGLARLRFTSPHPRFMSPRIVGCFGRLPRLCEAIHLPVQSGSDAVLRRMGRRYDSGRYLEVVGALREACPEIAISTDLIVGYPGESEAEFAETLALLEQARFTGAFSFKYSPRPGTRAARLDDDVPAEEKSRRLAEVHRVVERLEREARERLVGQRLEVLVEGRGRNPGQLSGRARNNQIVNFVPANGDSLEEMRGMLCPAEVTAALPHSLEARPAGR